MALALVVVLMVAIGHTLIGVIAAALYVIDLAAIGPIIRIVLGRRVARAESANRRSL